ncbi:ribulose-phosphate 3-epimerase [bacterium]|nr:ribulose-phosphate 3-epimerase [bacterium]
MQNTTIIPSIIAQNQEDLDHLLQKIGDHAHTLQLDVMDGQFVPSRSLDFGFELPFEDYEWEAHLMIKDPSRWIQVHGEFVDTIIVHFESLHHPRERIDSIKSIGKRAGLALNPETDLDQIKPYLNKLDQVLVMTVHPGYYGSSFLPETTKKIKELRRWEPQMDIEVDGGIKPETIGMVYQAGANLFVSGSYLVHSDNFKERMQVLRDSLR